MTQPVPNSNYTTDEINAVVTQLVQSTISFPYDTLGVRRTDVTFDDIQQAAAGIFILYPSSPFYVLQLGMSRVQDQITAEDAIFQQLLAAVGVMSRSVQPVADVSPLFNIQSALQNLGTAATARAGVFTNVTTAPAYQQYKSNLTTFLNGPGQAVKQGGNIVQTPQQAVAAIPGLMTQLQTAHTALVASVLALVNGIVNYNSVNLPSVVISSVLSAAGELVGNDATTLAAMTPTERLVSVRSVVLNLLATQAVIDTYGVFSGPTDFYALIGLGSAYSDVNHAATPATVTADFGGSYSIVTGVSDDLNLAVDGAAGVDIILNASSLAEIDGQASDSSFVFGNGTAPVLGGGAAIPNNNLFKFMVNGTLYTATLPITTGATAAVLTGTTDITAAGLYGGGGTLNGTTFVLTANGVTVGSATLSALANAAALIAALNGVFNVAPNPVVFSQVGVHLVATTTAVGTSAALLVGNGTANTLLGFTLHQSTPGSAGGTTTADAVAAAITAVAPAGVEGEAYYSPLRFNSSMAIPAGVNQTWTLTVPGASDLLALGVLTTDTAQVMSGVNSVGGPASNGIFYITAVTASSITVAGTTFAQTGAVVEIGPASRRVKLLCTNASTQVPAETTLSVVGPDAVSAACLTTLGMTAGATSSCSKTTPDLVAADINSKTGLVTAGTVVTTPIGPIATAHGDVTNPNLVVFMEAAVVGSTSYVGMELTFTITSVTTAGSISVGDTLALRSGPNGVLGYIISTINGQALTDHAVAVGDTIGCTTTGALANGTLITAEFGPTVNAAKYQIVTITGGPNNGTYTVTGKGATAIDVLIQQALPMVRSPVSPTTNPITMAASIGGMYLTLSSKSTTTSSKLVIGGNAAPTFFSSSPKTQLGTSQWFLLPSIPAGLQAGDLLEYYPTDFTTPSFSYEIVQVITSLNVIQVDADPVAGTYPPNNASWQFTPQPVPFARLRYGILNNFTTVQAALETWLDLAENQALYFQNLNALINPLLVGSNPTAEQVGAAVQGINDIYQYLTTAQAQAQLNDPTQALQSILKTFTIEPVPAIDTLIATYTQKGADAAIDTLLGGDFATFFGMTNETASYAGAFQVATRAVATNDLPVRKVNRAETQTSQMTGQTASPDLEYSANAVSEVIQGPQVDPPADAGEPSNYGLTTGSTGSGNQ
jgi:hypothetical protein